MGNNEGFNYTYSAKEQEEIKAIRKKYAASEETEDKMTQLRRLDASVYSKASAAALAVGIVGALIMGIGIGVVGIVLVCLAYPIYNRTLKKEREKIAPEILRLTDELMK